ncbi:MAG TPA: tyrosine-type recombinase/integrase [Xanthobacteraceae bacterium]
MLRTRSGLPKHCSWNFDRHGKRRVRFRKGGFSTYLTGTPWSEEFMRQYAAALDGVKAQASNIGAGRTVAGTVNALIAAYLDPLSSSPFKTGAAETQRTRRNILENFRTAYGHLPVYRADSSGRRVMLLTREHVQRIVNEKSATPFAQRNFLNTLRAMFRWAATEGRVPDDPTLGVTRQKAKTTGYKTWTEAEIERFEIAHPIGTKGRLAFALILYTGLRRSDVVKIGRRHVHNGVLTIEQGKTEGGEEAYLEIPLHPKLCEIIDATPTVGVKTFLVTHFGKPYTAAGFGNWFRELCDQAGCFDISAHGGRKATARRLAEIGCSANQIAAITGHASISEVQRYTKAADRKRMAREAMKKLTEGGW